MVQVHVLCFAPYAPSSLDRRKPDRSGLGWVDFRPGLARAFCLVEPLFNAATHGGLLYIKSTFVAARAPQIRQRLADATHREQLHAHRDSLSLIRPIAILIP